MTLKKLNRLAHIRLKKGRDQTHEVHRGCGLGPRASGRSGLHTRGRSPVQEELSSSRDVGFERLLCSAAEAAMLMNSQGALIASVCNRKGSQKAPSQEPGVLQA